MRTGMLWMAIGIAVVAWLPVLPSLTLLIAVCTITMLVAWLVTRYRQGAHQRNAIALAAFVFGFTWASGYGFYIRSGLLPGELEQQSLLLQGRIEGLVEQREGFSQRRNSSGETSRQSTGASQPIQTSHPTQTSQRATLHFRFAVDADHKIGKFPRLIQLNWYGAEAASAPKPGERWQLRVKLKRPRGFSNPGGFDYEAWLIANRIGATGYVEHASDNQLLSVPPWYSIDALRGRAQNYLQQRLQHFAHRDLVLGLLIGDGGAIETSEWDTFRATGTVHLFVVSGLQIAFTGGLVLGFARLWWRSPWCSSRRHHYFIGALPALLVAVAYAALAGWGVPIQRALIMFFVFVWALVGRRRIQTATAWIAAAWLVLMCDPLAVRDIGFWFSFVAVATILLIICGHRSECRSKLFAQAARWWHVQWALFVTSLPLLLGLSGQITLLALPANFIAIPLSTLISLPLAFLGLLSDFLMPSASEWIWRCADTSLDWLWRYLRWLQHYGDAPDHHRDWAIWQALGVDTWVCLAAAVAAALLLLPRAVPGKISAGFLLLPLFAPPIAKIANGDFVVTVIDVGQGLSVFVETAQHRMLYDTGPLFGPERAVADLTVVPVLRQRGVSQIDTVIISHSDNDHSGGWPTVAREFSVRRLLVGEKIAGEGSDAAEEFCRAGMQWHWDGVTFTMLHPTAEAAEKFRGNNRSCVLQISAGDSRVLLTGDIERVAENELLNNSMLEPVTLLLAPHHGSRSSSTQTFIERLRPQYTVFSAGYLNRFKHPSTEVMQRYRQIDAELFNTAQSGAITFTFGNGGATQIHEHRSQMQHYWNR